MTTAYRRIGTDEIVQAEQWNMTIESEIWISAILGSPYTTEWGKDDALVIGIDGAKSTLPAGWWIVGCAMNGFQILSPEDFEAEYEQVSPETCRTCGNEDFVDYANYCHICGTQIEYKEVS